MPYAHEMTTSVWFDKDMTFQLCLESSFHHYWLKGCTISSHIQILRRIQYSWDISVKAFISAEDMEGQRNVKGQELKIYWFLNVSCLMSHILFFIFIVFLFI